MKKLLGIVVLGLLWCNVGVAASSKSIKAIENCADDTWEKRKRDYRQSYVEEIAMWEKDINEYAEKGNDDAVNRSIFLLEGVKSMGKEKWKKMVIWETTYIKKPLKDKLNDMYLYEVYFTGCEKIRVKSPLTFDAKWK